MTKIKCTACGEYIQGETKNCSNCGYPLKQYIADVDYYEEEQEYTDYEIQKYLRKFNFGAFFLAPLWVFGNGLPWLFLVYLVNWLIRAFSFAIINNEYSYEYILFFFASHIINIVLTIYLGVKGNALAWEKREWCNLQHFIQVQKKWAKWGIIIWALYFILILLSVIVCIGSLRGYLYY